MCDSIFHRARIRLSKGSELRAIKGQRHFVSRLPSLLVAFRKSIVSDPNGMTPMAPPMAPNNTGQVEFSEALEICHR
jgi:hypothetical protein